MNVPCSEHARMFAGREFQTVGAIWKKPAQLHKKCVRICWDWEVKMRLSREMREGVLCINLIIWYHSRWHYLHSKELKKAPAAVNGCTGSYVSLTWFTGTSIEPTYEFVCHGPCQVVTSHARMATQFDVGIHSAVAGIFYLCAKLHVTDNLGGFGRCVTYVALSWLLFY